MLTLRLDCTIPETARSTCPSSSGRFLPHAANKFRPQARALGLGKARRGQRRCQAPVSARGPCIPLSVSAPASTGARICQSKLICGGRPFRPENPRAPKRLPQPQVLASRHPTTFPTPTSSFRRQPYQATSFAFAFLLVCNTILRYRLLFATNPSCDIACCYNTQRHVIVIILRLYS